MNDFKPDYYFISLYQDILLRLRRSGGQFAKTNPELASFLNMSNKAQTDPEIERMIESFAYMLAQVEYKSDIAQNEYLLQFIENILPEIACPVPSLCIGQLDVDESDFSSKDTKEKKQNSENENKEEKVFKQKLVEKLTSYRFEANKDKKIDLSVLNSQKVSPLIVNQCSFVTSSTSRENLHGYKKGILLKFESLVPVNLNKNKKTEIVLYMNSDFNTNIMLYDCLFKTKFPLFARADNGKEVEVSRDALKSNFVFDHYSQKNKNSNCLYPLFDICHYYPKSFFIKIVLPEKISISKNLSLFIPISPDEIYKFDLQNQSFLDNCINLVNYFEQKLTPIKTQKSVYNYRIFSDFIKSERSEIVDLNNVYSIDSVTTENKEIKHYYEKEIFNLENQRYHTNLFWTARRNFDSDPESQGSLNFKLISTTPNTSLPEFIYITAFCTNWGFDFNFPAGSELKPTSKTNQIPARSLLWIESRKSVSDVFSKSEGISFLFKLNQKILSNDFTDISDLLLALEILSSKDNPIYGLFERTLKSCRSIQKLEHNSMKIWNGNVFHVPGISFKFVFAKEKDIPFGFFYMLEFLRAYFSYVKNVNYHIGFEYEVSET